MKTSTRRSEKASSRINKSRAIFDAHQWVVTYVMADVKCARDDKHVNEDEEEGEAHVQQLRAFRSASPGKRRGAVPGHGHGRSFKLYSRALDLRKRRSCTVVCFVAWLVTCLWAGATHLSSACVTGGICRAVDDTEYAVDDFLIGRHDTSKKPSFVWLVQNRRFRFRNGGPDAYRTRSCNSSLEERSKASTSTRWALFARVEKEEPID